MTAVKLRLYQAKCAERIRRGIKPYKKDRAAERARFQKRKAGEADEEEDKENAPPKKKEQSTIGDFFKKK